jgi:plasmid stabilization system protein ParE
MSAVTWSDQAREELADIYVALPSHERPALVHAVGQVEAALSVNAQFEGESRSGNQRVCFYSPLAVTYALLPGGGVRIVRVRSSRFRSADE